MGGREGDCVQNKGRKKKELLFHIHSFSNEKKVQRVLKKYPCFFYVCCGKRKE